MLVWVTVVDRALAAGMARKVTRKTTATDRIDVLSVFEEAPCQGLLDLCLFLVRTKFCISENWFHIKKRSI